MELRHLRYFAAVAETCHFGKAAEQLHIAQPALSQSIRQLERELDVVLFTRTTRKVSLTPAGEFLRAEVGRILGSLDTSLRGVRRINAGRHGLLRLGLTGTATFSHLPRIARAIRAALPEIALDVQTDLLTPDQCDYLQSGSLDLSILRPPVSAGIDLRTISTEPLILAVAGDHPLAAEPVVSLADLADESFVAYSSRESAVNESVLRACYATGFAPRREHLVPGTAAVLALVAAGLGIAVLPQTVRSLPLENVVFRDLVDAGTIDLCLARATDVESPIIDAVLEVLEETEILPPASSNEHHVPLTRFGEKL